VFFTLRTNVLVTHVRLERAYPVDTQRHKILHPGASRVSSWGRLRDAEQGRVPSPVVGRFSQFNFADIF
jgi:hypothetical protein